MRHRVLGILLLCALFGVAVFGFGSALNHYQPALETAASVISFQANKKPSDQPGEIFVSLSDIIAASLLRLGNMASSNLNQETTAQQPPVVISENSEATTGNLSEAIVNIYCTQTTNEYKRSVSGTGFFISKQGVILTNAHVAQFLLLQDSPTFGEVNCAATSGTEGSPEFSLSLLYISPSWLIKHASLIDSATPRGTGENDFALIYVNNDSGERLPFNYLPPATGSLTKDNEGDTVILAGYPGQNNNVSRIVSTTTVTGIYTFGSGSADIFALDSSPLGYQGASGGPVINHLGRSIGVITTKESGTTILNAITISHIDSRIRHETGFNLANYIQGDLAYKSRVYNQTMIPILQGLLSEHLD